MTRLLPRSAGLLAAFALAALVVSLGSAPAQQNTKQPAQKKTEPPKKIDPKKPEPKKPEPKKPEPKPPAPKPPETPEPPPDEPEPIDGPPSPLELVRGLREHGMPDLGLELLHDLEQKQLPKAVRDQLPLERARCQLEAADNEADEGARSSMVAEAKDGFAAFLKATPNHPRAAEAYLALARLASLEGKAQLGKARRVDVPTPGDKATPAEEQARQAAIDRQKAEAARARELFQDAAGQFKKAADRIAAQLKAGKLDPAAARALARLQYDSELARGTNAVALADTYLHASAKERQDKSARVEEARAVFEALAGRPGVPAQVAGVARAWMTECLYEKDSIKEAEAEVRRVETSTGPGSEDAKRMVKFFQIRRKALESVGGNRAELDPTITAAKKWLEQYGSVRRAQSEAVAVRWYLANLYHVQGDLALPPVPKGSTRPPVPGVTSRQKYHDAEKQYRAVAQTDNEYTARATQRRMVVVRRLLGEADKPPTDYKTFEDAQMASLIQTAKLVDLEKAATPPKPEDVRDRRNKVVALLERARELATDKDSPADVADVLVRLVYFYEVTDQPQLAAVLGESVARTMKAPGGKASVAGALGLTAYVSSSRQLRTTDAEQIEAARRADRDRAIRLARFLDAKFPNDTATDRARHQLAALLYEDARPVEAYDAITKVRPGYDQVAQARLFQGALVSQLLAAKDSPLATERRREAFDRTVSDLDRVPKPPAGAPADDSRLYLTARCRLALLYLLQARVEPDREKTDPGYAKARKVAEEVLGQIKNFDGLANGATPTADGWEVKLLGEDARTRAAYLQGQALFTQGKYPEAYAAVGDILAEMNRDGPYTEQVKKATGGAPAKPAPAPKKEPEKKAAAKAAGAVAADAPEPEAVDGAAAGKLAKLAEGVDKYRRELIVLALKVRIKQGQADQATEQLTLLKKFGGSLEANVATLEQVTADMAAQIVALRRAGKPDEAKALTDGFAKLIAKIAAEPNLPGSVQRFLGQALILVGEYGRAVDMLRKVPAPADRGLLAKPAEVKDAAAKTQVLEYRRAALELVRAYRLDKKFAEADALLKESMGTTDKQGWAFTSLDFRKEAALLLEAKGTTESDAKAANKLWGEALKEWSTLYTLFRRQLEKGPPKTADGADDNAAFLRTKNMYFEAFFNVQRCLVRANQHLLKDPKFAPKLQKTYEDVAKRFVDLEKGSGQDMTQETRGLYYELLADVPELKKAYEAAGGKLFLERPDAGV